MVVFEVHDQVSQFYAVRPRARFPSAFELINVVKNRGGFCQCQVQCIPMKTGVLVEQVEQLRAIAFLLVRQLSAAQGFERLCLLLSSRVGWD